VPTLTPSSFVGTVECLDWILVVRPSQLEHVLHCYVARYNRHRPHRGLGLTPPQSRTRLPPSPVVPSPDASVGGIDSVGLIHEFSVAA
jgi:putative transposase